LRHIVNIEANAIRGIGSCKLKLGAEKRDADNFAYAMAPGPTRFCSHAVLMAS
jgi:hypothetical protein